jgi:hypothetical protein
MTVLAAQGGVGDAGSSAAPVAWPLGRGIVDLAEGTLEDPSGKERLVLCLSGEDVAPVFDLLTGVNTAHLGVTDGQAWQLNVRPHYPGYRLGSDPCQA